MRFTEVLKERHPEIEADAESVVASQGVVLSSIIAPEYLNRSGRIIFSLAVSDLGDLMDESIRGSGRAAMRSARSLVEHCINMGTVLADEADAERYLDHLSLGPLLLSEAGYPFLYLNGRERERVEHELNRDRRESKAAWEAALSRYGSGFKRSWHPRNLADRAAEQGGERLYRAYRIASNVAHGSAAGSIGHFRLSRKGRGSYSAGKVPELVPLALLVGADAYLEMLKHAERLDERVDASAGRDWLTHFMDTHYLAIREVARDVVREFTEAFDMEVSFANAYMVFSRSKRVRWYTHVPQMSDRWHPVAASAEDECRELFSALEGLIDTYIEEGGEFNEGGLAALELPKTSMPIDLRKSSVPGNAFFPRLVPSDDLLQWSIVEGIAPDGTLIESGTIVADSWLADGGSNPLRS